MCGMEADYDGLGLLHLRDRVRFAPTRPLSPDSRQKPPARTPWRTGGPRSRTWPLPPTPQETTIPVEGFDFCSPVAPPIIPLEQDNLTIAIVEQLRSHNESSFVFFSNSIFVFAVSTESTGELEFGTSRHYILRWNGCMAWAKFRLLRQKSETENELQICYGTEWKPFSLWLDGLPRTVHAEDHSSTRQYHLQYNWWKTTGQHFRLMDMPTECIRNMLLHIMGEVVCMDGAPAGLAAIEPCPSWQKGHSYLTGCREQDYDTTLPADIEAIDHTALLLNNQLHVLGLDVLSTETLKVFNQSKGFSRILESPRDYIIDLRHLRFLQLSFSSLEFFEFFGVQVPPFNFPTSTPPKAPAAGLLRDLSNLRELSLRIRSTDNPWSFYGGWHHPDFEVELADMDLERFPCQRALLDLIMHFAYRYLKRIHRVYLIGFVNTSARIFWDKKLNRGYVGHHEEENKRKLDEIKSLPPSDL